MKSNPKENPAIRLTVNEKTVLKMLLQNGQTSDINIANKLKVSSQAVSKIKRKLRSKKIIDGQTIDLNYGALGVNVFALALLETSDFEKCLEDESILNNSIGFYKVFKNDIDHIGLFGFNNLEELDNYFDFLHSHYFESIKVKHVYTFPMKSFFKHSSNDLFFQIIKELGKEKRPVPISLNQHRESNNENNNFKKINDTEKKVLKLLLQNDGITCRGIVSQLEGVDVTVSGVNKIKKRLEEKNIIKNYSVKLNYEGLGINILSFIFVNKKKGCWDLKEGLFNGASGNPSVIGCYKLNQNSLSVLFCGFRNLAELEYYCMELERQNRDLLNIEKIYIASPKGIIKNSMTDILCED
jgi:DNA-binding Lrp family transcriptional regulator